MRGCRLPELWTQDEREQFTVVKGIGATLAHARQGVFIVIVRQVSAQGDMVRNWLSPRIGRR